MLDFDAAVATLTPEEWLGVVVADEGGVLPSCCAEVSQLREALVELLVCSGMGDTPVVAARALSGDSHLEASSPLLELRDLLVAHLDAEDPGWRDRDLVADAEDLDEFSLRLTLTGTSSSERAALRPAVEWSAAFTIAAALADNLDPAASGEARLEAFNEFRDACDVTRVAGAPVAVVAALYGDGLARLRATAPTATPT